MRIVRNLSSSPILLLFLDFIMLDEVQVNSSNISTIVKWSTQNSFHDV